jgi:AraC-like DNA-binding protein
VYYQEFQPHPDLRHYVNCYWVLEDVVKPGTENTQQFLSDGGMELNFNLADPFEHLAGGLKPVTFKNGCVIGALTSHLRVRPTGQIKCFGARFHPGGAYPFFPMSALELTDHCFDLEALWGPQGLGLTDHIQDAGLTTIDRIQILEMYLQRQIERNGKLDLTIEAAVRAISLNKGQITVDTLAHHLNLSHRQLERKFNEKVGMPPKQLCRIIRFRYVFEYLTRSPSNNWASVALDCGYYDQSHLIREFKHFTGLTPMAYFNRAGEIDLTLFVDFNQLMSDFSKTG